MSDFVPSMHETPTDFAQFVMDDWGWKETFSTINAAYGVGLGR